MFSKLEKLKSLYLHLELSACISNKKIISKKLKMLRKYYKKYIENVKPKKLFILGWGKMCDLKF